MDKPKRSNTNLPITNLPINNPAERLYVILTKAAERNSGESSIAHVICTAMELTPNDENFIKGFSDLIGLLNNIEEQVKQYFPSRKKNGYVHLIKEIRMNIVRAFQLNYSTDDTSRLWKNIPCLNDKNWPILQLFNGCVEDFDKDGIKYGISFDKESLNKLINDVETWMKEIEESQLDEDVKRFFIHKLMEIKDLLEKYYYYGSSRIKTEIYATMMEIGIYQENLKEEKKEKSRSFFNTFWEKLFTWAGKLEPLISLVANGSPMISQGINIVKNLLSGS